MPLSRSTVFGAAAFASKQSPRDFSQISSIYRSRCTTNGMLVCRRTPDRVQAESCHDSLGQEVSTPCLQHRLRLLQSQPPASITSSRGILSERVPGRLSSDGSGRDDTSLGLCPDVGTGC